MSNNVPNVEIQALLEDMLHLVGAQHSIVKGVRQLVKEMISPITEEVKYGGILLTADVQFGGVFAYKNHVSVEFSKGALIDDAFGYLEGSGKGRRHLKLYSIEDIESKQLADYIVLALEAARADT